jgi:hypothetical protein
MQALLQRLCDTGLIADIALAALAAEILILAIWRARAGKAQRLSSDIGAALPGMFLLFALRAALTGAGPYWIALWLACSFPAHLLDLYRRQS